MKYFFGFILSFVLVVPQGFSYVESTAKEQHALEVTVYNQGLGLVKDSRKVTLADAQGELRFMDVASAIIPESILVKSLDKNSQFQILEQNYQYDLLDESKLLNKYVGKKVKLMSIREYQDRKDIVEATLLSNNGQPIFQIENEIYIGYPGIRILPEIPEGLIARPTLSWQYSKKGPETQNLEVAYLTNNISWTANYVFSLSADDSQGDLSGWVTLTNQSGTTFKNAVLKLVAGDVNRVQPPRIYAKEMMLQSVRAYDAGNAPFQERAFFEYHIYDLNRKTTLAEQETKQISLLTSIGIVCQKRYVIDGQNLGFYSGQRSADPIKMPVTVDVVFKNSTKNKLGMPLPQGTIRVYKKDEKGSAQFVGEDAIDHTPKNEEIKLSLGKAFDVVSERVQKDYKQVSTNQYEVEYEITIKNRKTSDVTVTLQENLGANWSMLKNSHDYVKKNSTVIEFEVPVPADKEVKVSYRARVGF